MKRYIKPCTDIYRVASNSLLQQSAGGTDIPVVGGGTEEFDAKGGVDWEDEDDSTPPEDNGIHVHFGW